MVLDGIGRDYKYGNRWYLMELGLIGCYWVDPDYHRMF